uniref:Sulfatase N-terminal domain-containing protein n=1 Tax=Timema cristinae TaxID=61476 RepID=A0A7R9CGC6_TIMCR|nr:unnamed protein product [Timema cristinae]
MNNSELQGNDESGLHCGKDDLTDNFGWFLQVLLACLAFTCLIGASTLSSSSNFLYVSSKSFLASLRDGLGWLQLVLYQVRAEKTRALPMLVGRGEGVRASSGNIIEYCDSASDNRSNIIVILTDDQDLTLGGLTPMIKTQSLIGSMGATFTNAFVTTPVCCPSRSSILTGVYLHNHGTVNNSVSGGCSSKSWQATQEPRSFSVPIHSAGYTTFYAGKYLNQYGKRLVGGAAHVPPGWDWWVGLEGNSVYYNYTLSVNGTPKEFTNQYLTNVILDYGLEFLRSQSNTSTNFFMVLATPACHAPFTPEPKYKDYFSDVQVMKTPNFNISNTTSKHWLLRMSPTPLPDNMLPILDDVYRNRWKTLLTVDDMVETVISELNNLGILNDTYIVFTSDHGYHIGQFSLPWDKRQPYESDIRVPLLIRGPNISTNKLVTQPVLSIDLAPTLLEMAGLDPPDYMDGVSYLSFLTNERVKEDWERVFLVEYHGEGDTKTVDTACPLPRDDTLAECVLDEM